MALVAYCTELSVEVFQGRLLPSQVFKQLQRHPKDFQLISAYRSHRAKKDREAQEKHLARLKAGSR